MNETIWRSPQQDAGIVFGALVLAGLMLWGGSCERTKEMSEPKVPEIVESVKKLDPKEGDALLVKINVEINGFEQRRIGCELSPIFPGVLVYIAGPSADIEVVRRKLANGWNGKEEEKNDG